MTKFEILLDDYMQICCDNAVEATSNAEPLLENKKAAIEAKEKVIQCYENALKGRPYKPYTGK